MDHCFLKSDTILSACLCSRHTTKVELFKNSLEVLSNFYELDDDWLLYTRECFEVIVNQY